jgi:VIT1/CCC1 family predicted Fe2+/Mn2+ transporter
MNHLRRRELGRFLRNWREECDSAALYDALATVSGDSRLGELFRGLATSERGHAEYWEKRLRELGHNPPRFRPTLRTRLMGWIAKRFGIGLVIPNITTRELADEREYSAQEDARAAGLASGEGGHVAIMRRIGTYGPAAAEADTEARHETASVPLNNTLGNVLRASVLGITDGVVSNFCLTVGVAGGGMSVSGIELTGLAGLVAGACSMALGEWLSVTNAYEMDRVLSATATGNDPAKAAAYSFGLFAVGAVVPLLPFLFSTSATRGLIVSAVLSLSTLFVTGLATSFFNGRSAMFSGFRQAGVGSLAAAVTYVVGSLFGTALR